MKTGCALRTNATAGDRSEATRRPDAKDRGIGTLFAGLFLAREEPNIDTEDQMQ
jgi:hypothetical protein